ncbi:MAG: putative FAD-linked oxidoreductase [Thermoanaerobaculia bacterium]|nr:putative FAD-linked oxidoreductase [Thermoanaerobaculia bacterium]
MTPEKPFRPLSESELAVLRQIAGEDHVLVAPADLQPFSHDWTEDFVFPPAAVARPRTVSEVSRILAFCNERRIPVTPQGGRTGLSGGALPLLGGLALCLDRMNSILEIDEKNAVATVEPGVVTQTLHEAVEALGLSYPPDPASRGSCTIGGNLAENAGGPHAAKYGVTGKWVMGLEAVLASGDVIVTGGKTRKDVAGYDLTSLLVGSEGTLAVVTKAWLRLIPKPAARAVLVAPFATLEESMAAVVEVYRRGLVPAACEFVDRPATEVSSKRKGVTLPFPEAEARLLLEFDGGGDEEVERDVTRAGEAALDCGALDVVVAADERRMRELWEIRRGIGEAVRDLGHSSELDVAVPRSELAALVRGIREIASEAGFSSVAFGHAADGNIHVHVYGPGSGEAGEELFRQTARKIYALAASLGGTVTGEHGVGITSRDCLSFCRNPAAIAAMRAVKDALDPRGILNPGKLFPPLSEHGEPR